MRRAIDLISERLHLSSKDMEERRAEIARIVLSIANQHDCDAPTLAKLALEKMASSKGSS